MHTGFEALLLNGTVPPQGITAPAAVVQGDPFTLRH